MLEDYGRKLEQLTETQLVKLVERYQQTIKDLYREKTMAEIAAMLPIIKFKQVEIAKKEAELQAIKKIMAQRGIAEKE